MKRILFFLVAGALAGLPARSAEPAAATVASAANGRVAGVMHFDGDWRVAGGLPEKVQGRFAPGTSLPVLCSCLRKAALDPRISGIYLKLSPLQMGWGKLQASAPPPPTHPYTHRFTRAALRPETF